MFNKLKRPKIKWVSLCPKGKNRLPVIFKEDGTFEMAALSKMGPEGLLTTLVYAPGIPDTDGDFADPDVVKEMAYSFQKEGGQLDIRHDGRPLSKDQAWIAETFLVQKGDPRFEGFTTHDGQAIDPSGSWGMVIKVEDLELRKLYEKGEWQGVSLAGWAEREPVKEPGPGWLRRMFGGSSKPKENEDMDEKVMELFKSLQAQIQAVNDSVKAEREARIEAERKALEKAEADARAAEKAELEAAKKEAEDLRKEIEALKAKSTKKSSNQGGVVVKGEGGDEEYFGGLELEKEEADAVAEAIKAARQINKEMERK